MTPYMYYPYRAWHDENPYQVYTRSITAIGFLTLFYRIREFTTPIQRRRYTCELVEDGANVYWLRDGLPFSMAAKFRRVNNDRPDR